LWCATEAYPHAGTKVEFNGIIYESQWWANAGEQPGVSSAWKKLGGQEGPGGSAWSADTIYDQQGTRVERDGVSYSNKWWTRGDDPATHHGPDDVWAVVP
jgi:chitodextrinase